MYRIQSVAAAAVAIFLSMSASADEAMEEIIVTADLRERTLAEIPASVSRFDAAQLRSATVQHFEELIDQVPNLNWSGEGNRARYFQLRGVGELEQYEGAPNPSVGFLIDHIDFSGIGAVATLFDIESVEVLRGPQGSRYGANALAGLIAVRSRSPGNEFAALARVSAGNDDMQSAGIAAGGPLNAAGTVRARVSLQQHRSDGFRSNPFLGRDDTNGRDELTARARLEWEAGENWDVEAAALFVDLDNGYDAFAIDNSLVMRSDRPGKDAQESLGASVLARRAFDNGLQFTAITAAAQSDSLLSFDADWGNPEAWDPVTYDYISHNDRQRDTLSQELRLQSERWVLGAYALSLDEDLDSLNQGVYFDPGFDFADSLDAALESRFAADTVAVFGEYDVDLGPAATVTFGLRLEQRDARYRDSTGLSEKRSDSLWGGEVGLTYAHSPDLISFASLSRGFKAGGFNLGFVPDDRRGFGDESLLSLEYGLRWNNPDHGLRLTTAVFTHRREDQQVRTSFQLVPGDPASFVFFTDNAARSEAWGLEADVNWQASEQWGFFASVGLLRSEFERFVTPQVDLSGRDTAHSPAYSLSVGGQYQRPNGFFARVTVAAKDDFYFDVSHDQRSERYELVSAKVGFEGDNWQIEAWARNLFDETHAVRGFFFGNEPPNFPPELYIRQGDPRAFGITYERSW